MRESGRTGLNVLEANVESGIGKRGENDSLLSGNVLGLSVIVSEQVADLIKPDNSSASHRPHHVEKEASLVGFCKTYVHVHLLSIALVSAHNRRDDNQSIPPNKIPYASLPNVVGSPGFELEFKGVAKRGQKE